MKMRSDKVFTTHAQREIARDEYDFDTRQLFNTAWHGQSTRVSGAVLTLKNRIKYIHIR